MAENQPSIQGLWRTDGYNKLFEIDGQSFRIFDLSAISCIQVASGSLDEFFGVFDRLECPDPGQLTFYARGGITRYTLNKQPAFNRLLLQTSLDQAPSPCFNFRVFWQYFQENYAFFELRGLDWQAVSRQWTQHINEQVSPEGLLDTLREILIQLGDSHATLSAGTQEISTKKPHALVRQWQREFNSSEFLGLYARGIPRLNDALQRSILKSTGKSALNGQLLWGQVQPGVGYLAAFSLMDIYAGFDQLHYAGFEVANLAYLQRLEEALDAIMADLGGMQAIIFDMRFNLGGHDGAGLAVARRFADRERLVFTKQARSGSGFTAPQPVLLQPLQGAGFTRPVALLTSEATASAAEVLVHGMMALPHVTRVGGTTRGVLSDMLLMQLPNGWKVSLSNEIYRVPDGCCYEGSGVPPQVDAITFIESDFYESLNLTIYQALENLGFRSKP